MNIEKIEQNLQRIFHQEDHRLVFWFDSEQEFVESVPDLHLDGVHVLHLDQWGSLELKLKLEREDIQGKYLLYAPFAEPNPEQDWLLDIKLYSHSFQADQASIILDELGLAQHSLKPHLQTRKQFFRSKERLGRLKKWVEPEDGPEELDRKMLAVAVRAEYPEIFSVTMKLLSEYADLVAQGEERSLKSWEAIRKCGLEDPFWWFMEKMFGSQVQSPSLQDLALRLFVTDLIHNLPQEAPQSIAHFVLTQGAAKLNCTVFLSQWRNHVSFFASYNRLAQQLEQELQLDAVLDGYDEQGLLEVMTFPVVERIIIKAMRDRIITGRDLELKDWDDILEKRKNGHWAGKTDVPGEPNLYLACYHGLEKAHRLYEYRSKYTQGLSFSSPINMFQAYQDELYRIDQLYRHFCEQADQVEMGGWDVLKGLQEKVEDCYSWFLDQMSLAWDSFLGGSEGQDFLHNWSLSQHGIQNQQNFFSTYVQPILRQNPKTRVFVIVSDALRYEAAQELLQEINSKYRFQGKLETMLGVVPSYTALGMAALLPHKSLKLAESKGVLVDDKPSSSLEQRSRILSEREGMAIRAEKLFEVNKDQGRELIKPHRVISIYHDRIDSTGDNASSEDQTFQAVRNSIQEIDALIRLIINSLNGTHVFVTADHGFSFSRRPPQELDKSQLGSKPEGFLEAKKRYILGSDLGSSSSVWHGYTKNTAGTKDDTEFWVPKGLNRFHFVGGAKFIHGGAALQEVVIPVLGIREMKGKEALKSEVRKVGVSILGSPKKVTSTISRFQFIQTEAVSERVKSRSLLISLRDENELISNEEKLTFDSQSESLDHRKKSVKLTLKQKDYDNKKDYYLVLRDSETQIEYDRIPLKIDLAFMDEF